LHAKLPEVSGTPKCPAAAMHIDECRKGTFTLRNMDVDGEISAVSATKYDPVVVITELRKISGKVRQVV